MTGALEELERERNEQAEEQHQAPEGAGEGRSDAASVDAAAALVAELDRLIRNRDLHLGAAYSAVVSRPDPLDRDQLQF